MGRAVVLPQPPPLHHCISRQIQPNTRDAQQPSEAAFPPAKNGMRRGTAEEIRMVGTYLCWTMQSHTEILDVAVFLLRSKLLSPSGTSLGQSESGHDLGIRMVYTMAANMLCISIFSLFFFFEEPCTFSYKHCYSNFHL